MFSRTIGAVCEYYEYLVRPRALFAARPETVPKEHSGEAEMEPRPTSSTQAQAPVQTLAQAPVQVKSTRPAEPSRPDSGTGFGELLLRFAAPIAVLAVVSSLVGFEAARHSHSR